MHENPLAPGWARSRSAGRTVVRSEEWCCCRLIPCTELPLPSPLHYDLGREILSRGGSFRQGLALPRELGGQSMFHEAVPSVIWQPACLLRMAQAEFWT